VTVAVRVWFDFYFFFARKGKTESVTVGLTFPVLLCATAAQRVKRRDTTRRQQQQQVLLVAWWSW
jgi:hypothetical protein